MDFNLILNEFREYYVKLIDKGEGSPFTRSEVKAIEIFATWFQGWMKKRLIEIAKNYPQPLDELIQWHDFMGIQCLCSCIQDNLLGICVATSNFLERLKQPKMEIKPKYNVVLIHRGNQCQSTSTAASAENSEK